MVNGLTVSIPFGTDKRQEYFKRVVYNRIFPQVDWKVPDNTFSPNCVIKWWLRWLPGRLSRIQLETLNTLPVALQNCAKT